MNKEKVSKIFVIIIIFLFIGIVFPPAFTIKSVGSTFSDNKEIETFNNGSITRMKIIEIAEAYVNHEWYPTESNVFHGFCNDCNKWVDTPDSDYYSIGWEVDKKNIGIPYQWGGFSSLSGLDLLSEEDFDEQYTGTGEYAGYIHFAGDINCVGNYGCSRACGVDCSGFVSRCWNLPNKQSTSSLPNFSNKIKYEYLKPGDILDKPGYHVILFKEFVNEEKTQIRTIEANFPRVFEDIYYAEVSQDGYSVTLNNGTTYQIYSYEDIPNSKPNAPIINGPNSGKLGQTLSFKFNAIDPDGDDVSYFIDWGDNSTTGWTRTLPSGTFFNSSHIWTEKENYTIKAKSMDIYGAESDWAIFEITIPKIKVTNLLLFLQRIFHRFPFFEKILNQII